MYIHIFYIYVMSGTLVEVCDEWKYVMRKYVMRGTLVEVCDEWNM